VNLTKKEMDFQE